MRIRALSLIVLTAAWLVPAGDGACPTDARRASQHAHAVALGASGHAHDASHHGFGAQHSGAESAAPSSPASDLPADGSSCCRRAPRVALLIANLAADTAPRVKMPAYAPRAPATIARLEWHMRSRAPLPGGLPPPPDPFARTRRPLLI